MRWVLWVLALLPVPPTAAEVQVRVAAANGLVDVRAQGAPLSEILDRLADQTGMKVRYDGAPPRVRVTVALEGRTPAQAVLSVLDGLGLDYALSMDTTGTRVSTLLITGVAPTAPAEPASTKSPARSVMAVPAPPEPEPDEESPLESEPEVTEPPRTPSEEAQRAVAAAIAVATGTKAKGSGQSQSTDDGSSTSP